MRTTIVLIGLIAFVFHPAYGQNQEPCPIDSTSRKYVVLDILSKQDSLSIFLDKNIIGKTPLLHYKVTPGPHNLIIQSPYWPAWNISHFKTSFVATPPDTILIQATFSEKIIINSVPHSAEVYLDNVFLGITPLSSTADFSANKHLKITKNGYHPYEINLDQKRNTIFTELVEIDSWAQKERTNKIILKKKQNFYKKRMYLSLALTAVAGLVSVHYHDKGNDEYALYQSTANPNEMNQHFDKVRKYDRISNASYIAFEVGFVLTAYQFIKSKL